MPDPKTFSPQSGRYIDENGDVHNVVDPATGALKISGASMQVSTEDVALADDGVTRAPLNLDANGALITAGGGGGGGGGAVTVADGADAAQGTTTDALNDNPATAGTVIAFLKGLISVMKGALTTNAAMASDGVTRAPLNLDAAGALITSGGGGGGGGAVTVADGADAALGTTTDASNINPASAGTAISFLKGILATLKGTLTFNLTDSAAREVGKVSDSNRIETRMSMQMEVTVDGTAVTQGFDIMANDIVVYATHDVWIATSAAALGNPATGGAHRIFVPAGVTKTIPAWKTTAVHAVNAVGGELPSVYVEGYA